MVIESHCIIKREEDQIMSNKKSIFSLLLLFNAMQLYSMDKNISSKCTLFSTDYLQKEMNGHCVIGSLLMSNDNSLISNEYRITNSLLLWDTIQVSSSNKLHVSNSLLLGVDIINKYGDKKSVPHQNIKHNNAVIVSKKQLLIGVGLIVGLYCLRRR